MELPRIISVDDHVLEPPNLWLDRLPAKYHGRAPRVQRSVGRMDFIKGSLQFTGDTGPGSGADGLWLYDDLTWAIPRGMAQVDRAGGAFRTVHHLRRDDPGLLRTDRTASRPWT